MAKLQTEKVKNFKLESWGKRSLENQTINYILENKFVKRNWFNSKWIVSINKRFWMFIWYKIKIMLSNHTSFDDGWKNSSLSSTTCLSTYHYFIYPPFLHSASSFVNYLMKFSPTSCIFPYRYFLHSDCFGIFPLKASCLCFIFPWSYLLLKTILLFLIASCFPLPPFPLIQTKLLLASGRGWNWWAVADNWTSTFPFLHWFALFFADRRMKPCQQFPRIR